MEEISHVMLSQATANSTLSLSPATMAVTVSVLALVIIGIIISAVLVLVLSCIFQKKQPLKSRGCTYVVLLVVVMAAGIFLPARAIALVFAPAKKDVIRCYFDLFAIGPIVITFVSLLLARNIRFIFLLNINRVKNLLFGNTKIAELLKEQKLHKKRKEETAKVRKSSVFARKSYSSHSSPIKDLNEDSQHVSTGKEENNTEETASQLPAPEDASSSPEVRTITEDTEDTLSSTDEAVNYFDLEAQKDSKALKRLRCLKFMTSYWITFAIVGIILILWYLFATLYTIGSLGNDPNCYLITPGINFGVCIALYAISFFFFGVDVLLQIREVAKCRLYYLFCQHDKFLFRIEFLLIAGVNLILVFNNLLLAYIPSYADTVYNTQPFAFVLIIGVIAFLHIFALAGFVLVVTIIWECKKRVSKRVTTRNAISGTDQFLDVVMKDSKLQTLFRVFCEQEWSLENFLCYQDISLWNRRVKSIPNKLKIAAHIYEKYIKSGCSLEVNISNSSRDKTREVIQSVIQFQQQYLIDQKTNTPLNKEATTKLSANVHQALDLILKEVKSNLNDTLFRFTLSTAFTSHMDAIEFKETILQ